jgi:hypothetical protein
MATTYSDQLALATVRGNQYAEGNRDINARQRVDFFTLLTAAQAVADNIVLASLPKGARIMRGVIIGPAGAAGTTLAIGTDQALVGGSGNLVTIPAGPANLLAAAPADVALALPFAASFATGAGFLASAARTNIVATVGGAPLATGTQLTGYIEYTVN